MIYFTSSWDDGAPDDIKLSEMLLKYDMKATFFIPLANVENRDVVTPKQMELIAKDFEIGAHTVNHKYLTRITDEEAAYEIRQSKKEMEIIINKPVHGFCFPGGKHRANHVAYIFEAGYKYARTNNMFKLTNNEKLMNTTLQTFNHSKYTYFKHLLKRGYFNEIFQHATSILSNNEWDKLMVDIIAKQKKKEAKETVIHLWGHSWELEENNSWNQLERFLKYVKENQIESKTNFEIAQLTSR